MRLIARGLQAVLIVALLYVPIAPEVAAQNPEQVEVVVKPGNASEFANSTPGNQVQFYVIYSSTLYDLNDFDLSCTNGTGTTSCDAPSSVTLAPGDTATVTVTFTTTSYTGTGSVQLTAEGMDPEYDDTGSDSFQIKEGYAVVVTTLTADADIWTETTGHTALFSVENTGFLTDTYSYDCRGAGPLLTNCQLDDTSEELAPGVIDTITATFDASGSNVPSYEHIYLEADGGQAADSSFHDVDVFGGLVDVQPNSGSASDLVVGVSSSLSFDVINTGSMANTFTFTCGGTLISCSGAPSPSSSTDLPPGDTVAVTVNFTVGQSTGSAFATLAATGSGNAADTGKINFAVVSSTDPLVIDLISHFGDSIIAGSADNVLLFEVTDNQSGGPHTIVPECLKDWGVVTCDEQGGSLNLSNGERDTVVVHVDALESYPDSVEAKVSFFVEDASTSEVDTVSYEFSRYTWVSSVSELDQGAHTWPATVAQKSSFTGYFTVQNVGTGYGTFVLTCEVHPSGSCSPDSDTLVALSATDTITVTGNITGATDDQAEVTLTASALVGSHEASDTKAVHAPELPFFEVTPAHDRRTVAPDTSVVIPFEITYKNAEPDTFFLTLQCTGDLQGACSMADDTIVVDEAATVLVTATTGNNGESGDVRLAVTRLDSLLTDTAAYNVSVQSSAAVTLEDANPAFEHVRGSCLSVAAGFGAIECDDFRYVYPLASPTTLNRTRNLGLLYTSEQGHRGRTIGANITVPDGTVGLTAVAAYLKIDDVVVDSLVVADSLITVGVPTRFAFDVDSVGSVGSPIVHYQVDAELRLEQDSVATSSETAYLLVPDNDDAFGRGWSWAGQERIDVVSDSILGEVLLWTGGDGSSRLYLQDSPSTDRWVGQSRTYPDTIVAAPGASQTAHYLDLFVDEGGTLQDGSYSGVDGQERLTLAFWLDPAVWWGRMAGIMESWPERSWWVEVKDSAVIFGAQDGASGGSAYARTGDAITRGAWNFVIVEFDGTESANADKITIWADDQLQTLDTIFGYDFPDTLNTGTDGQFGIGVVTPSITGFNGKLGELVIIADTLTTTERTDWYQNGIDFDHPGMVAGYRWDEDLTDASSEGNDLVGQNIQASDYDTTSAYPSRGASTGYIRRLLGGGEVHYDAMGRHVTTVDRNGNETRFSHSTVASESRLSSIEVPTPSGTTEVVQLGYDATSAELDSIKVLAGDGGWLRYDVHTSPVNGVERLDSIVTPDALRTSFGYDATVRFLNSIREPRGAETVVTYSNGKVASVAVEAAVPDTAVLTYEAAASRGLEESGPVARDSLAAYVNGPRETVLDTTRFFLTHWGAVRGTRDAFGHETWIERGDDLAELVTKVTYPNGRLVTAVYTSAGLLQETEDHSISASTEYQWNTTWRRPTRIDSPEDVVSRFDYDGNGNRTVQAVGPDSVRFAYTAAGMVDTVTTDLDNQTVYSYDLLGNLASETSPMDYEVTYARDARGLDTLVVSPIDSTNTKSVHTGRDQMGRPTVIATTSTLDSHWVNVHTTYDDYGLQQAVTPYADHPAQDSTSSGGSSWTYDALGRVLTENNASKDSLVYDVAGNIVLRINVDRADTITTVFDALNRPDTVIASRSAFAPESGGIDDFPYYSPLDSVVIEPDTAVFTYTAMGQLWTARNRWAHITRTYRADGALESDLQAIRDYAGSGYTTHAYEVEYVHDRDGRRLSVEHPNWITSGDDITAYAYDAASGRLSSVEDPHGNTYTFLYNAEGQVTSKRFMGSGVDTLTYDDDGRQLTRRLTINSTQHILDSIQYDDRGKILEVGFDEMAYTGLGHLNYFRQSVAGVENQEWLFPNGLGIAYRDSVWVDEVSSPLTTKRMAAYDSHGALESRYQSWTETEVTEPVGWDGFTSSRTVEHGLVLGTEEDRESWDSQYQTHLYTQREESRSYYDAHGRLRYHQVNRDSLNVATGNSPDHWGAFEEYWYDALGRRILKYSRQDTGDDHCNMSGRCYSAIERTIWDGDQILAELRRAGSSNSTGTATTAGSEQTGEVVYVHAGGVDAPIGLIRNNVALALHSNWRGLYAFQTDSSGAKVDESAIAWPAGDWGAALGSDRRETQKWYGSLPLAGKDASGFLFRRNRYYDPKSGQFTQEDPIGIAGGLNLYGYANGDPINFSDPFGLCPWCEEQFQRLANFGARRGGFVGGLALNAGALGNAALEASGINDVGSAIANRDVVGGSLALAGMLPVGRLGRAGKALRWDIDGGALGASEALDQGARWLGEGYTEIASGVFRSADNTRQFRMVGSNLEGANRHVNFEVIGEDGRTIIENSHVRIR